MRSTFCNSLHFVTFMLCEVTFSNSYVKWRLLYVMPRSVAVPYQRVIFSLWKVLHLKLVMLWCSMGFHTSRGSFHTSLSRRYFFMIIIMHKCSLCSNVGNNRQKNTMSWDQKCVYGKLWFICITTITVVFSSLPWQTDSLPAFWFVVLCREGFIFLPCNN